MKLLHECLKVAVITLIPMAPIFIGENLEHKKDQHTITR
jgi:hypothetical protein